MMRTCVLAELPNVFAAQRDRRVPSQARLMPGTFYSTGMGTAGIGHLMSDRSPISYSVLLAGIDRTVRETAVTCDDLIRGEERQDLRIRSMLSLKDMARFDAF